jgi:K+-sensing histidine kinase KdpD
VGALSLVRNIRETGNSREDVFNSLVSTAEEFFGFERRGYLLNEINLAKCTLTCKVMAGELKPNPSALPAVAVGENISSAKTTTEHVARQRQGELLHDLKRAEERGIYHAIIPAESVISAPIQEDEKSRLYGVLNVVATKPRAFTERSLEMLENLCTLAATIIARIEEHAEAEQRRAHEEARQKEYKHLAAFAWLLNGLKHDLGAPAGEVSKFLESLALENPEYEKQSVLAEFVQHGFNAYQLFPHRDTESGDLTLATPLKRKARARGKSVRIGDLIETCQVALDCQPGFTTFQIEGSMDVQLRGDTSLLLMSLYNLMNNAISHGSQRSSRDLRIRVRDTKTHGHISVIDNNPRISKDVESTLFEFSNTPPQGRHRPKLGLPITKLFVEAHPGPSEEGAGRIKYKWDPLNKNNIFTISVELAVDSEKTQPFRKEPYSDAPKSLL